MKITRDVIEDLLPAYVAGEASTGTVALVQEYLRQNPDLLETVAAMRASPLGELPAPLCPTDEKRTLDVTRRLLGWRGILMGLAIFLTLLPLSFKVDDGGVTWFFLQKMPTLVPAVVGLAAAICWAGFFYVRRRLRNTGL